MAAGLDMLMELEHFYEVVIVAINQLKNHFGNIQQMLSPGKKEEIKLTNHTLQLNNIWIYISSISHFVTHRSRVQGLLIL